MRLVGIGADSALAVGFVVLIVPFELIYLNQGALFAVPFDLKRLEVVGQAVPALDEVAMNGAVVALALAADGTLLYKVGGG